MVPAFGVPTPLNETLQKMVRVLEEAPVDPAFFPGPKASEQCAEPHRAQTPGARLSPRRPCALQWSGHGLVWHAWVRTDTESPEVSVRALFAPDADEPRPLASARTAASRR